MDPLEILLLKPVSLAYFQKMTKACLSYKKWLGQICHCCKYCSGWRNFPQNGFGILYCPKHIFSQLYSSTLWKDFIWIHRQLESNTHYGRKKFLTNVIYQRFLVTFSFYAHIAHHTQRMLYWKENTENKFNFCCGGKAFFYYISKY